MRYFGQYFGRYFGQLFGKEAVAPGGTGDYFNRYFGRYFGHYFGHPTRVEGTLYATEDADQISFSGFVETPSVETRVPRSGGLWISLDALERRRRKIPARINGDLAATESPDRIAFSGQVVSAGSLGVAEQSDQFMFAGVVADRGNVFASEAMDRVAMKGETVDWPDHDNAFLLVA
jgi:hypothetical protein